MIQFSMENDRFFIFKEISITITHILNLSAMAYIVQNV